jgi:hypothetical protein
MYLPAPVIGSIRRTTTPKTKAKTYGMPTDINATNQVKFVFDELLNDESPLIDPPALFTRLLSALPICTFGKIEDEFRRRSSRIITWRGIKVCCFR